MRRTLTLSTAALLLTLAGCASTATSTSSDAAPTPTGIHITAQATAVATTKATKKPKAKETAPNCGVNRDVIVREVYPSLPVNAYVLGSYNAATCEPTFQMLQDTSPTGAGYCTEAAWGSDNPGYNADATPAKRLKKIQVEVGPAC